MSYRRADASGHAGRLRDSLAHRLGERNVFHDVTAITPGEDFVVAVDRALDRSDAVIGVIGPEWLTVQTPEGMRRLDEPDDIVRLELRRALERDVPVVPVLVGGAGLPDAGDLPDELGPLVRRQAVQLRDDTWQGDVDRLLRGLRGEVSGVHHRTRRLGVAAGVALLAVAAGVATMWSLRSGDDSEASDDVAPEIPFCDQPDDTEWTSIPVRDGATGAVPLEDGDLEITVRDGRWRETGPAEWLVVLDTTMENLRPEASDSHDHWWYEAVIIGGMTFDMTCFDPAQDTLTLSNTTKRGAVGFDVECPPTGAMELVLDNDTDRFRFTEATEPSACF